MIHAVFESSYGYNTTLRLGKIYVFTSLDSIKYLLEVNKDLILLNYQFNKFNKLARKYLKYKIAMRMLKKKFNPIFLHEIQLGKSWREILNREGIKIEDIWSYLDRTSVL